MNIVLSFIGHLPHYIKDCIFQIRLFYDGKIYLILDDVNSPICNELINTFNVILIPYENVFSVEFMNIYNKNIEKFVYLPTLAGRTLLMMRSLERFFLLEKLLNLYKLTDVFFMELDNLIYDNPNNWNNVFSKYELCYMYDNINRCSSGIMYVKNEFSMQPLTDYILNYIDTTFQFKEWLGDMVVLYDFYKEMELINSNYVHILPTIWKTIYHENNPHVDCAVSSKNFELYNESIFDAAGMGVYLFGIDRKPIVKGIKSPFSKIDYTVYKFKWVEDEHMRKIPYILNENKWIRINNLHIHSKQLLEALS